MHYLKCICQSGRWIVLLCLAVSLINSAHAADKVDLYSAVVPVLSKSAALREKSMHVAFEQVLLKLTGSAQIAQDLNNRHATEVADLVRQFNYQLPNAEQKGFDLIVQFDVNGVKHLLSEENVPLWSDKRPLLMPWLLIEKEEEQVLVGADPERMTKPLVDRLTEQLSVYALPVVWPLWDLSDQAALTPLQLKSLDLTAIQAASTRYGADALLVGRIHESIDGRWLANWNYFCDGEQQIWATQAFALADLTNGLTQKLVGSLAAHYAIAPQSKDELSVTVMNVDSMRTYASVLNYFQHIDMISHLQVMQLSADKLTLHMAVKGGKETLLKTIRLDKLLQQLQQTAEPSQASLELRWVNG